MYKMNTNRRPSQLAPPADPSPEARYRATFHQPAIGIAYTARDGTLIDVNEAFCALLAYQRAELVGVPLAALEAGATGDEVPPVLAKEYVRQLFSGKARVHSSIDRYRRG